MHETLQNFLILENQVNRYLLLVPSLGVGGLRSRSKTGCQPNYKWRCQPKNKLL